MNRLTNSRAYLCGAMDRAIDGGVGWRRMIKSELDGYGIHWFDPCRKPIDIALEDDESKQRRTKNKADGSFDAVALEMLEIRNVDLRMVRISDWLIVNLDLEVHACGTYREIFLANDGEKPILTHVEQGKENTPDWLFSEIPHEYFFSTWTDLVLYVRGIASGEIADKYDRWFFFNWMGTNAKRD